MSMHVTITLCVLIAVLLCTVHLLLGVWIGSIFRSNRLQLASLDANPPLAKACSELQARVRDTATVSDQANQLFKICAQYLPALPADVVAATDRLAKSTSALRSGIEAVSRLFARRRQAAHGKTKAVELPAESHGDHSGHSSRRSQRASARTARQAGPAGGETRFSFSHEELKTIADSAATAETPTPTDRYQYDVFQQMAPLRGELPQQEAFREVRCRDLSRGGFSFFAEEVPDYESLVVALGFPPDLKFLVAHVEHHRQAEIEGQQGYLIGCRFVKQLADCYLWDATCGSFFLTIQSQVEQLR